MSDPSGLHRRGTDAALASSYETDGEVVEVTRGEATQQFVAHGLETPGPRRVLDAVLRLSRQISLEMDSEEIVHAYVDAFRTLFPGRLLAIRLLSSERVLALAYATGRLHEGRRSSLEITRETLEVHGLDPDSLDLYGIQVVERRRTLFEDGSHGFDVPIADGSRLAGLLTVEYASDVHEPAEERALIGQMALHLGAALRNARLLRESTYLRDHLGKLIDHANAPIAILGRHREIRVVNQALLALMQMKRHEVLGRDFMQLLPEAERPRLLPVLVNALRGRSTSEFEVKLSRSDGGVARIAINVASILGPEGEIEGVISVGRDLTEVRELESQVLQAEKLATLGQLAAGVVHELNNPLTSISVYSDYLLRKNETSSGDPGDREKLRRIVESAERILRFTRDLVTYARPSEETPRLVSIERVIEQALVFCEHLLVKGHVQVEKRFVGKLPPVYGVESQLHQVFINLFTNACQAMPGANGTIAIAVERGEDQRLRVQVRDTGMGIPKAQRDRIFEPFFSTKAEGEGTGLGLSIVRNIVEQHGGIVSVDSEVGAGTTFTLDFPCRPE